MICFMRVFFAGIELKAFKPYTSLVYLVAPAFQLVQKESLSVDLDKDFMQILDSLWGPCCTY